MVLWQVSMFFYCRKKKNLKKLAGLRKNIYLCRQINTYSTLTE